MSTQLFASGREVNYDSAHRACASTFNFTCISLATIGTRRARYAGLRFLSPGGVNIAGPAGAGRCAAIARRAGTVTESANARVAAGEASLVMGRKCLRTLSDLHLGRCSGRTSTTSGQASTPRANSLFLPMPQKE